MHMIVHVVHVRETSLMCLHVVAYGSELCITL